MKSKKSYSGVNKFWQRGTALLLAVMLAIPGMQYAIAENSGSAESTDSGVTANDGSSIAGYVADCASMKDLKFNAIQFGGTAGSIDYSNNTFVLTDSSKGKSVSVSGVFYTETGSAAQMGIPVSMNHNWECTYVLNKQPSIPQINEYEHYRHYKPLALLTSKEKPDEEIRFMYGPVFENNPGVQYYRTVYDKGTSNGSYITWNDTNRTTVLGADKEFKVQYNAAAKEITMKCGGATLKHKVEYSDAEMFYGITASTSKRSSISDKMETAGTFKSFGYKDYNPQITGTRYLDARGREITGRIGKGQIITVEIKAGNKGGDGGSYSYPAHLKLGSNVSKIEPMPFKEQEAKQNGQPIALSEDSNMNSVSGIPVTIQPMTAAGSGGTTITYKAKVTGDAYIPDSKDVSLNSHILTDDYFEEVKESYADAGSIPSKWAETSALKTGSLSHERHYDLESVQKNKDGFDYSYGTDVTANSRGWFNKPITLTFRPTWEQDNMTGFDEFYVNDGARKPENQYVPSGTYKISTDTNKDGKTYRLYGALSPEHSGDGLLHYSAVTEETIKLDQKAPGLMAGPNLDRVKREFTVTDNTDKSGTFSGIAKVEVKKPKENTYSQVGEPVINDDEKDGPETYTVKYDKFDTIGTYTFKVTDAAGNTAEIPITNTKPEIKAADLEVKASESGGISLYNRQNVQAKDAEDGSLAGKDVRWTISKKTGAMAPKEFEEISGKGSENIPKSLPIGSYTVTWYATDCEGNDSEAGTAGLNVLSDGVPGVIDKDTNKPKVPERVTGGVEDGTPLQAFVSDEYIIMVDKENPYNGGLIVDPADVENEVISRFDFKSMIGGDLTYKYRILMNGADYTYYGIDTTTQRDYVIEFTASDKAGNSVTLNLTCKVREDYFITFDPGKGEFANGDLIRTGAVKCNKTPSQDIIPGKSDIKSPVERTFIGWSTEQNAENPMDILNMQVTKDITYYAVYAVDLNRDDIDDREQALYIFKSSDYDQGLIKAQDGLTVGLDVEEGEKTSIEKNDIPGVFCETGYYLNKWKLEDKKGDDGEVPSAVSTDGLCEIERGPGTILVCTADYGYRQPVYDDEAVITYFSENQEYAKLDGGDGVQKKMTIQEGKTESIKRSDLPAIKFEKGYSLEGWKTDETGDQMLTTEELCSRKFVGGSKVTCIAYLKYEPEQMDKPVTFTFFSSDSKNARFTGGDGTSVNLTSDGYNPVSIAEEQIPDYELKEGYAFKGWKTSETGDRLLSTEELCRLSYDTEAAVSCVAYFESAQGEQKEPDQPDPNKKEEQPKKDTEKTGPAKVIKEKETKVVREPGKTEKKTDSGKVVYAFYSGSKKQGSFKEGDGVKVMITAVPGQSVSLGSEKRIPAYTAEKGSFVKGWKTSVTGNSVLTTKELCQLRAASGSTINCTAQFAYKDVGFKTKTISDEKVPLGASPVRPFDGKTAYGWGKGADQAGNCFIHWLMAAWALLTLFIGLFRVHHRKNQEFANYSDGSDWGFMIASAAAGVILFTMRRCSLELPLMAAGELAVLYYLVRMKMLDHKSRKIEEEVYREIAEKIGIED